MDKLNYMKVILLRDIKKIGRKYEVKEVNDGFARNGLIGTGAALPATPENLGRLKAEMAKVVQTTEIRANLLGKGLSAVEGLSLEFTAKAGPAGHLFADLHATTIAAELAQKTGLDIHPDWLDVKAIKTVGEHNITLKIGNQKATFKVVIINQK